jgi:hypothetical protein
MSKTEFASLLTRILALWLFVQAITSLSIFLITTSWLISSGRRSDQVDSDLMLMMVGTVQPIITLVIGIFLWKKAEWVASRMVAHNDDRIVFGPFSSNDVLSVVFAGIGMYVLLFGASRLFANTIGLLRSDIRLADAWASSHWQYDFWSSIFQIGIGVWLTLGVRGIVRAIKNLQRGVPYDNEAGSTLSAETQDSDGSGLDG